MIAGVLALTAAILVVGQMLLYRFCGYKKITYSREYTPNTVFEGENVTMTERISNAKLLPMPWLRVESMLSPHLRYVAPGKAKGEKKEKNVVYGEHNSVFSVGAYQTVTRRYQMLCEKRGYYALRAVNITCQDIFGIGEPHTAEAEINAVVTVYPRIADPEELGDLSKNLMGDVVVRRWIAEDPFMIRGTREYTTSDPQSKINWKASARTGELMVNENDYTADIKLMVYFNVQADQYFQSDVDPDAIEAGVSRIAYILQFAAEHGISAAFASNSVDSPLGENRTRFGSGKGHLGEEFTQLACLSRQAKVDFARFLGYESESGLSDCGILIVSTYIDERIEEQMEVLRQNGNVVAAYLLPRTPGTYTTDKTE
ncbi:MAG: DUF58 domain-containing protein [Clostridia bacterium]|nr:DUF58 domain-containing protein [Clostridia bacterium]